MDSHVSTKGKEKKVFRTKLSTVVKIMPVHVIRKFIYLNYRLGAPLIIRHLFYFGRIKKKSYMYNGVKNFLFFSPVCAERARGVVQTGETIGFTISLCSPVH